MDPYKKLKGFSEQANKNQTPKTWWQKLLNVSLKTLLVIGAITLLLAGLAIYFVGEQIDSGVTAILERVSIGMPDDKIRLASTIAVLGFTFPIVWAIFTFWKNKILLASIATGTVLAMVGFYHLTEEEMFGEGREARFLCDSPVPTDPPFPHRSKKNPRMKGDCEEVTDPVQVAVAIAIMRAQKSGDPSKAEPRVLTLEEIADPRLELFKNKRPLVYMSKMEDKNGLRQMRAGPWFDGFSPGTMVPATWVAVEKVRQHLADKKTKEVELAAKKADDEAKAKSDAAKAADNKVAEKDKLYWKNRYIDLVTGMNVEARKAAAGGLNEAEMDSVRMMYINLGGELDKTKLMLPKAEWPNMRLESLPNARKNETRINTHTTKSSTPPSATQGGEAKGPIVLRIKFFGRSPPSTHFNYGDAETHDVKQTIEMSGTGKLCGSVKIQIGSGLERDVCELKDHSITGGSTYTIYNKSGGTVSSENM